MTFVIRTTLLLLAVFTMVTFTADAHGQLFRRLRENIRSNYSPQLQSSPAQYAPQQLRQGQQPQRQTGQTLTPYSRLTPEQRNQGDQNANPGQVNVRVVTYLDPRTGRTYQRHFLVPANNTVADNNAAADQSGAQKVAGGNGTSSAQGSPNGPNFDKIPKPIVSNPPQQSVSNRPRVSVTQTKPKLDIPSITLEQSPTQIQPATTTPQRLPTLAGPADTVTPAIQPPTEEVEAPLGITIADASLDNDGDIQIDTAVTPATATSSNVSIGSSVSEGALPATFSVLESLEDTAQPESLDLDIDSVDDVEAFFAQ